MFSLRRRLFITLGFAAWFSTLAAPAAPRVTTPKQQFGFNLGDDYHLANYRQLTNYWAKLDRESGVGRGASLWALGRGRFTDPSVAAASGRGFLVGLVCGGVLVGSVLALEAVAGARTMLQPRGFFFYALNSASPSLSTLLFFLNVALAEELGYRFFGATWLLSLTRRRWVAVLVPAVLYGLTHTTLDFLPPAEPFWGRPLALTLVGCVWGWAFLRYDALTVVLSHFTADLFIFNWPRLASGRAGPTVAALLVVSVPLLPACLEALRRRFRKDRLTP